MSHIPYLCFKQDIQMRIIGTFMNYELMICGSALEKERGKRSVIDLLPHIHEIKLKLKSLKKKWGGGRIFFVG